MMHVVVTGVDADGAHVFEVAELGPDEFLVVCGERRFISEEVSEGGTTRLVVGTKEPGEFDIEPIEE